MAVTHDSAVPAEIISQLPRARHPDALLYTLWGLFCTLLILVAMRDYYRGGNSRVWEPLLWEGSSLVFATCLLVLQRTAGRRYAGLLDEPRRWFGQNLKWLPLAVLTFIGAVYGVRHWVYSLVGESYRHEPWAFVIPYEAAKFSLFMGLWLGVIFSFDSFARWQSRQQHLLALQRALSDARLSQLGAQLRPHFFFNALNTISALMHLDVARADRLLARLGDLLRASLAPGDRDLVPLREEIRLLELYAQIMLERFADRVTLTWKIDDAAMNATVPAMLLQPLLENAFKHAVERGRGPVSMEIAAYRGSDHLGEVGGNLILKVRNTGSRLAPAFAEGVGLRNTRERLQVLYGAAASIRLETIRTEILRVETESPVQARTESTGLEESADTRGARPDAVEATVSLPWREHSP